MISNLFIRKNCFQGALLLTVLIMVGCHSLRGADGDLLDNANTPSLELTQFPDTNEAITNEIQGSGVAQSSGVLENGGVQQAGGVNDSASTAQAGDVVQADGDASKYFDQVPAGNRLVGFLTPFRSDASTAKNTYQQGDKIFKGASKLPRKSAKAVRAFAQAAKDFRRAGEAAPGSALQQDALFMQAESHFFSNDLIEATEAYQKLQKDFPRNKHSDKVAARLFQISRYWIETSKAGGDAWYKINLTDNSRPSYDAKGHAVKVLDQIRYDDPTGRLADDATIAAAEEYFRQEEYEKADEFLTDLRETFTDSDHMFSAHMLGIATKLRVYAGPEYSGLVLEEAETLIEQVRKRFPDQLRDQKFATMVAKAAAEVNFHKAERFMNRATYRENRKEYGAAASEYRRLLTELPGAPQAKKARERFVVVSKLPAIPDRPLSGLRTIFPDKRQASPLETVNSTTTPPSGPTRTARAPIRTGIAGPSNGSTTR